MKNKRLTKKQMKELDRLIIEEDLADKIADRIIENYIEDVKKKVECSGIITEELRIKRATELYEREIKGVKNEKTNSKTKSTNSKRD